MILVGEAQCHAAIAKIPADEAINPAITGQVNTILLQGEPNGNLTMFD